MDKLTIRRIENLEEKVNRGLLGNVAGFVFVDLYWNVRCKKCSNFEKAIDKGFYAFPVNDHCKESCPYKNIDIMLEYFTQEELDSITDMEKFLLLKERMDFNKPPAPELNKVRG